MNSTISIQEVATLLNYKDIRSAEKWCEKNNVKTFSDEGSNKKYIIRMQFEYARLKKFIEFLKTKYKDKWSEVFNAYMNGDIIHVVEIEDMKKCNSILTPRNYKPQNEHEKKFLSILSTLAHEL